MNYSGLTTTWDLGGKGGFADDQNQLAVPSSRQRNALVVSMDARCIIAAKPTKLEHPEHDLVMTLNTVQNFRSVLVEWQND